MPEQLDFSILSNIRDPELRASIERLGSAITEALPVPLEEPSSSAKIFQFPLFPEATRPVSNDMARSALFSCIQGKDRRYIEDTLLASQDGIEVRFTGKQLNQDDHDLLMQLVFMAQGKPLGAWVTVSAYAILTALGRQTGGLQYRELRADVSRLAAGMVSIRNARKKIEFIGHHLLSKATQEEVSRHWVYRLDPDLRAFYGAISHTLIDWQKRRALQGKDLARWLQLYIASHAEPFPVKTATLKELSGSRARALKNFRAQLRKALDDLIENRDIKDWMIEMPADLVKVDRGEAITSSQKRHIGRRHSRI
jgi:hypothetical protein